MRLVTASLLLAFAVPAVAQRPGPDSAITQTSRLLASAADGALARGRLESAFDNYEAALAADPKNRTALIGMGRVSARQGLPGKAARFYRQALALEPNDVAALEEQGDAFAARGAGARAQANLDRIKVLCKGDCPPAQRLAKAIAAGPTVTAEAPPPKVPAPLAPLAPKKN